MLSRSLKLHVIKSKCFFNCTSIIININVIRGTAVMSGIAVINYIAGSRAASSINVTYGTSLMCRIAVSKHITAPTELQLLFELSLLAVYLSL